MVTVRESCKEKNHHWDTTFLHFTIWAAWNLSSLSIKNRTVHTMSPCLLAPSGKKKKKKTMWNFSGDPVAKTRSTQCRAPGFDFWSGS